MGFPGNERNELRATCSSAWLSKLFPFVDLSLAGHAVEECRNVRRLVLVLRLEVQGACEDDSDLRSHILVVTYTDKIAKERARKKVSLGLGFRARDERKTRLAPYNSQRTRAVETLSATGFASGRGAQNQIGPI